MKVNFILDESAVIGKMDSIINAVGIGRGYGIRLHFSFQSLGQLEKCFPKGEGQTLLGNTSQLFFGVNDNATAEWVSNRLGEETIIVDSGGTSGGTSTQRTHSGQPSVSGGQSRNSNQNWAQQARKLLKPEEVMALPLRTAITFTPGMPPICTHLIRYYEKDFTKSAGSFVALCVALFRFVRAVALCGALVVGALVITPALYRVVAKHYAPPTDRPVLFPMSN